MVAFLLSLSKNVSIPCFLASLSVALDSEYVSATHSPIHFVLICVLKASEAGQIEELAVLTHCTGARVFES